MMSLKHFVYISRSKIDALYEQLEPYHLRRVAKSLKIDLKLVAAEFTAPTPIDTGHSRLRLVLKQLEKDNMIGSADDSYPYFRGECLAFCDIVGHPMDHPEAENHSGVLLFAMQIGETVIVLGGSSSNLVGGAQPGRVSDSFLTPIVNVLGYYSRNDLGYDDEDEETILDQGKRRQYDIIRCQRLMAEDGVGQKVEFVARRLAEWSDPDVVVGTPIYVALAD